MDKYRPETKQQKKQRLGARAEQRTKGKDDVPTKRPLCIRSGVNTVTALVEQKKAQLVIIAHDVDPIEVYFQSLFGPLKLSDEYVVSMMKCDVPSSQFPLTRPSQVSVIASSFLGCLRHCQIEWRHLKLF